MALGARNTLILTKIAGVDAAHVECGFPFLALFEECAVEIACLDLEGVLVPEIWIAFAEKTGIESLRATTRDVPITTC